MSVTSIKSNIFADNIELVKLKKFHGLSVSNKAAITLKLKTIFLTVMKVSIIK